MQDFDEFPYTDFDTLMSTLPFTPSPAFKHNFTEITFGSDQLSEGLVKKIPKLFPLRIGSVNIDSFAGQLGSPLTDMSNEDLIINATSTARPNSMGVSPGELSIQVSSIVSVDNSVNLESIIFSQSPPNEFTLSPFDNALRIIKANINQKQQNSSGAATETRGRVKGVKLLQHEKATSCQCFATLGL